MAPSRMKLRVRCPGTTSSRNAQPQSEEDEGRRQERHRSTSTRSRGRRKNNRNNRNTNNATEASHTTSTTTSANVPSASPLPSSSSTATARQVVAAEDTSPDSKCPICLDRFNNLAYLDRCLHRFCFMCIQEWSHNKAECPLCKQPFTSILHSVRGENDFQKYTISRSPENGSVAATVAMVAAMASDHRMRLTLRRSSTNRSRRNQRMVPVWEWLVDSPPDSPEFIPISPVVNAEETQPFDLAERGIIFEGLTGLGSAGNLPPFVANNRETRKLLFRLAARRRLQREGGRVRPLRDRETIALRRGLYRCGIRVRGIAGSNRDQPQREISVESFCHNPSNLNRLRPWIRRELAVLYGSHDSLITIVQRIILARIARHGLEDLPVVEDELRPFLLARTDHFLHELVSFARSPLTMENYDIQAVYEPPDVAFNVDALDSSTDSSAVIAISEEEEERERGGAERVESVQESQASLSMTGWDDETPGPSYSMADSSCYLSSFSPALHEPTNRDRGETLPQTPASPRQQGEEELEEECLIVGYKKPIAERTPELVQLSSDSEEEKKGVEEEEKEGKEKDGEKEEKEKEGKEPTEKQPEKFFPVLTPSPQCREEIVEDAQPSRSHSDCTNPGQSLTEALLRVLGKGCPKSKRKKRERRRNKRLRSSSGTSQNQNSSNVSTPSHRSSRSPSPESSFDSDFRGYSIVSPLNSSCPSTPKSSSTSCFGSSPSLTPPPREKVQRNTEEEAAAVAEKPGGKRKYKSRHLDSHARDPTWRPSSGKGCKNRSKAREMERMRKEEREKRRRRRRRERRRREREESRSREERSPSVEIVYEGTISSSAPKRKRRRHRNSLLSSPPLVITLDSESDRGPLLDHSSSACSSPFGSQQTVDFCHFPALPLVHSSGVGGTLEGRDIGELPVDILDRGSEKSDMENRKNKSTDLISLENSSDSNTDIDVEKVETSKTPNREAEEVKDEPEKLKLLQDKATSSCSRNNFQESSEIPHKSHSDDADQKLLDSILSVLDGISTKSDLPSTSNHVKNNILPHKPKNQSVDSFQSMFYPSTLPPFQQLTENRTKFPSDSLSPMEKSNIDANRTDIASEIRSMHNLETHHEIASSLLALRDPKNNSLSSQGNRMSSSEIDTTGSAPNSDSLLSNLTEKPRNDLVREKVCSDSRADLDIRKYNSTNAEDVK